MERKYIAILLATAAAIVLSVAAFNFIVNPVGLFNPPEIRGFNDIHPAGQSFSRLQKIEAVKRLKPDVIITGSSRADNGLSPTQEVFPGLRPYNFALSAASVNEQRRTLEFAQAVNPLKKAVITLDFFAFNGRKQENKQFEPERLTPDALKPLPSFFDTYGTVVALDTLVASIKHLRYIKKPERYAFTKENGHKEARDVEYAVATRGAAHRFISDPNAAEISTDDYSFNYSERPGDDTFRHFGAMLDFARQHGIEVYLVMSPVHETYLRRMQAEGKMPMIEEWKKRLADINRANAAKFGAKPYPLWDFFYINEFTAEAVPSEDDRTTRMRWFWDSNHYKAALGDIVLRKVVGGDKIYPQFGRRIM